MARKKEERCKYCGHLRSDHAKPGPKPDHPGFRTLAKQMIDRHNTEYYPTSDNAFCGHPLCDCLDYIGV